MRLAALLAVAAAFAGGALAASGCGGDDEASPGVTVPTTAPGTTTPEPAPLPGASTSPATSPAANDVTALLTDVRAARHDGYDRVVFELDRALPGYDVRYLDGPALADGSGAEVAVDGAAVLQVRMERALDADLEQEGAPLTYTGPTRFSPDSGTAAVVELVRVGGFEGVLTWAVGVSGRLPFRVSTLQGPPRVVIDVRAP